MWSSLRDP
jgi:hypothetical protein